ncbi:MAG: RagB/SusD family nutrient uptake outer membrane protein, partial [Bacteroidales bacterium]
MKRIKNILLLSLIIGCSSCADFLDMEPTTSVTADGSIQSVDDAEVMLNGLMYRMSSSSYYGRNFILYGDTKGGDLAIISQGRGFDALYTFNHSASTNSYSTYWSQMYNCMAQVNNIIENIELLEAEGSEEDFSQIKGQALTTRANIYYDLVRLYGQPYDMDKTAYGVPDITTVLDASAQPLRATVAENYDRIISDLTTAIGYMDKGSVDGYHSYYSNLALQARAYLSMENYDSALKAAEEIITSEEYQLYENENWYSSWTSQFGSESIFEIKICVDEADLGTSSLGYYLMPKGGSAMGWFMASDYYLDRLGE